jgi:hypothetical protein
MGLPRLRRRGRFDYCFKIQLNDDAGFTAPYHLLSAMVRHKDPGDTRAYYDEWVG